MKHPLHLSVLLVIACCVCVCLSPAVCSANSSQLSSAEAQEAQSREPATATIPGPLRSFLRMAGVSQKVSPEEVMPLLARNVFIVGYEGTGSSAHATEFLILLRRYVQQARELASLAGSDGIIRVTNCSDAKSLLDILGYRTRPDCGKSTTFVETADARRAFLTIDSGFPLPELEKTLQGGTPFTYPYPSSRVPILLTEADWRTASKYGGNDAGGSLVDVLLHDPSVARLYYAWAHMDPETQTSLQRSPGMKKLVPLGTQLDFYGSFILIRSESVVMPGGPAAEPAWKELVGANPRSPSEFVSKLLTRDDGWLASYFDSLSRVPPEQQAHFVEPSRLRPYYQALRGKSTSPSATASVFRPDPNLLLLITRMQWEPNGDPHIPGNLQAWKTILKQKAIADDAHRANVDIKGWKTSDGLVEVIFALSRYYIDGGPTDAFLTLSEIDAKRPAGHGLSAATVVLMAEKFREFRDQYLIFTEFPELDDASITAFLTTAESVGKIPDHTLRGNAMGIFEANVGLWQILARQGEIAGPKLNESWQEMIKPFAHMSSPEQLFDAGRNSLAQVLSAASGESRLSQDDIVELMAGPRQTNTEGQRVHREVADRIRLVLDDQHLVSLDTLLALSDGLGAMAHGNASDNSLLPLAEELTEFQMPRPIFTKSERTEFTTGTYNNRHTDLEMRTDIAKLVESKASGPELGQARGELVPFLRDTLVGLSYAYYEPPGAQALHNNPLLIRSHDFSGDTIIGIAETVWQTPRVFGIGSPAGGGAHLVGSLSDLPYVLAQLEQDFIAPENVQALIWPDVTPCVLAGSVLPRWWNVSSTELHAVALYQRAGEELLSASAQSEELRSKVMTIFSSRMAPQRWARLEDALHAGQTAEVSSQTTPADTFYLTAEFRRRYPGETSWWGPAGRELQELSDQHPLDLSWERLSRDFGVPHPVLARTYGRELLNVTPFPMFQGYSSRLLAENWDSTNLYWARLADEMGYAPVALNRLAPELTVRMIAKIFATDLNDWPALLRAMRETGEEFRQGKLAFQSSNAGITQP
jgi:hypothetical protein